MRKEQMELMQSLRGIEEMEHEGKRYKAKYILLDIMQKMKRGELSAALNFKEVLSQYDIDVVNDTIVSWGNTESQIWKDKLYTEYGELMKGVYN